MDPADCVCPECPTCGSIGDPKCYAEHGLKLSREQAISRQKIRVACSKERLSDDQMALEYLEGGGEFSEDLSDDTDPWR